MLAKILRFLGYTLTYGMAFHGFLWIVILLSRAPAVAEDFRTNLDGALAMLVALLGGGAVTVAVGFYLLRLAKRIEENKIE